MTTTMASSNFLSSLLPLLATLLLKVSVCEVFGKADNLATVAPMNCSANIRTCNALLYHVGHNLPVERIASLYLVDLSQIKLITIGNDNHYLIKVPCACKNTSDLSGYFYDTSYLVKEHDTFMLISSTYYSGQPLPINRSLNLNETLTIHLPCGCSQSRSQIVVTYVVKAGDTTAAIASMLNATLQNLLDMNPFLLHQNTSFIDVNWVLFVPMELKGLPVPSNNDEHGKKHYKWTIIIGILAVVALLSIITMIILIIRRKADEISKNDPKAVSKSSIASRAQSIKNPVLHKEYMEDPTAFESERPVIYNLEEIEQATKSFDETRRIGVGGYGSVYFGILGEKEVAVKKMRSNKSKEFYAELKVLCKIHHINIVELLGYASGEDHLYLVYEYIPNGSLSDHLHDPLLKGYQPLSWTARVQIALDAAKGLEYIHDYTKARYVHRDIKTSNILLDEKLRAKVADFGLAKLVERSDEDDFIATRLVGTPGYLPPESVKELQVTPKTDVFAFGVVLAELVTGKRALFRDRQEASNMKSLITVVYKVFQDDDPEAALEDIIDMNLQGNYPLEDVYKVAETAEWCMREDPLDRPEMREIIGTLSQIVMASIEWEASLGGNSQVFSGLFDGR